MKQFRNLKAARLELHPRFNLLSGNNGQGKTNLLEAVVVLGQLRSFRARRSRELLQFGEDWSSVRGVVEEEGARQELEVQLRAGGRRALVGGKAAASSSDYLGKLTSVVFTPEDLQVPRATPGERRRFLDRAIAGSWAPYYELQRGFERVLQTRNRVLRERSPNMSLLLEAYDQQLAELGSRVVASRRRYVRGVEGRLRSVFGEVSRSGVSAGVEYRGRGAIGGAGEALKELELVFLSELRRCRGLDVGRQVTSVGPQTDDLEFSLDGRSAGAFGSQGQLRTLMMCFKLAQIQETFDRTGSYPLLLLDDVSSELDPERNSYLFSYVDRIGCQTLATSARPEMLPRVKEGYRFSVVGGVVASGGLA